MKNPFKSIAAALDKAISGGEVDVIVMDAQAAPQPPVGELGADAAGEATEGTASNEKEDSSDLNAGDASAPLSNQADVADAAEGDAAEAANADGAEDAGADAGVGANASAETASMPSVQQMLGDGQVAVDAAELESLRVDAGKWKENATELENLRTWKANGSKENVLQGAVDAADAVTAPAKKVSVATQKAIDLKNKMAGN